MEFSSLSPDPLLLMAAEEKDIIHIFDARTFETSQTVQTVGGLSGASFVSSGQKLFVGNADKGVFEYYKL